MSIPVTPSKVESREGGGTADLLPAERAKASFNVDVLRAVLSGLTPEQEEQHRKWEALFDKPIFDKTFDVHDSREEAVLKSVARSMEAHSVVRANPDLMSTHMGFMIGQGGPGFAVTSVSQSGSSPIDNHYSIFVGALLARASEEQLAEWLPKALHLKITGAYGQTELSHGSNVRALQTTATYDKLTEEFVIHSPTLGSTKWWPGCFGIVATHAVIYARLIIDGKQMGVHEFLVQLRDEDHNPMPGIELGDVGPKTGYNNVDNGFLICSHVRIPRFNMLAKQAHVTKEGEYVVHTAKVVKKDKGGASAKLKYIVMIQTRVAMVHGAGRALAAASTIAIRYSAVRKQGFKNTRDASAAAGAGADEHEVLHYQMQQYRLFKSLSRAYAFTMAGKSIFGQLNDFRKGMAKGDVSTLPDLHGAAAGLKAFVTNWAGDSIEDARRCCGGHGALLSSGVGMLVNDFNAISPIAEGDKIVLALQTARYVVRAVQAARDGKPVAEAVAYLGEPDDAGAPKDGFVSSTRDLAALESAFAWRARRSVKRATAGFEAALARGAAFDDAWNGNAVALVKAAQDHTNLVLLRRFASTARRVEDARVSAVLQLLAVHFALVQVHEDGGDWVGVITPEGAEAVRLTINELLEQIRPEAVALVDAFGFRDDQLKSSAIGREDGAYMEALLAYAKASPLNKPEFIRKLRGVMDAKLDKEYLRAGAAKQRAGATAAPRSRM